MKRWQLDLSLRAQSEDTAAGLIQEGSVYMQEGSSRL